MKKILPFFVLLLLASCKSSTAVKNNDNPSQNLIPEPSKNDVIMTSKSEYTSGDLASALELKDIVTYLASDELQGRNTGTNGIEASAFFIEKVLKTYGIKPYYETYRDDFVANGKPAYNIVGFIEGNDLKLKNEIIILGAHYDHIGLGKKIENDSIANGANDNATGIAGVLAIAKHLASVKNNKRSVIVALFSAEEMGLLGSKHLAEKLKSESINLYTVVNIEMIGVPFTDRDYDVFISGYDKSNMATKINEYVGYKLIGFSEVSKKYNLFRASDNYPFYEAFKLPSHTISSCDLSNYDHYHQVGDEANKQNYEHMASLVNKLIPAVEAICNTPTKEIVINE